MRAAVIYYPGRVDLRALELAVQAIVEPAGWEPTLYLPTDAEHHGREQAHRALAQNATHIVVAGGDGTVRQVAEALAEAKSSATLGLVPTGTGNVLARNLNLNLTDLEGCVKRALTGNRHPLDLGLIRTIDAEGQGRETIFAVMAGLGLDAKIMQATDAGRKRQFGWVAYIEGGFKTLPLEYERLSVTIDGAETRNLKVLTLLVGNAGWLPGQLSLMPEASLDDGRLDLAAIGPRRFWDWVYFWSRVTIGNRALRPSRIGRKLLNATANVKALENLSGRKIRVVPTRPVELQIDGDTFGKVLEVEFEILPRALSLRV